MVQRRTSRVYWVSEHAGLLLLLLVLLALVVLWPSIRWVLVWADQASKDPILPKWF
ncbi:MAG: hypothetical protein AB1806_08960 [Acidobacteriota bacterium]